jgi:transposase-like protein
MLAERRTGRKGAPRDRNGEFEPLIVQKNQTR